MAKSYMAGLGVYRKSMRALYDRLFVCGIEQHLKDLKQLEMFLENTCCNDEHYLFLDMRSVQREKATCQIDGTFAHLFSNKKNKNYTACL